MLLMVWEERCPGEGGGHCAEMVEEPEEHVGPACEGG